MKANDGQCLNLVSFSASNQSAVVLTLLDRMLVRLLSTGMRKRRTTMMLLDIIVIVSPFN